MSTGSGNVTWHVPVSPGGRDPSDNNLNHGQPNPIRRTVTMGPMRLGRSWGNRYRPAGLATQTASFRLDCEASDLVAGEVTLELGAHVLSVGVDFVQVVADGESTSLNTAQALASVIGSLPGFSATATAGPADTGDLSIVWTGFSERKTFRVFQRGDVVHASLVTPSNGQMAFGTIGPAAPQFT